MTRMRDLAFIPLNTQFEWNPQRRRLYELAAELRVRREQANQ